MGRCPRLLATMLAASLVAGGCGGSKHHAVRPLTHAEHAFVARVDRACIRFREQRRRLGLTHVHTTSPAALARSLAERYRLRRQQLASLRAVHAPRSDAAIYARFVSVWR